MNEEKRKVLRTHVNRALLDLKGKMDEFRAMYPEFEFSEGDINIRTIGSNYVGGLRTGHHGAKDDVLFVGIDDQLRRYAWNATADFEKLYEQISKDTVP